MDLYLHIGTEKTGTTSVQKFFRANRDLLAENGVLYPQAPGRQNHTGLAVAAQTPAKKGPLRKSLGVKNEADARQFRVDLMEKLAAEFAARPYRLAVMSGEHCSSRLLDDDEVAWLREKLLRFADNIKIIVYVRRQDDYLLSTYSTSVKSGTQNRLAIPGERIVQNRYDHWNMLERWRRVFGRENIICRKFERASLKSGDIVDDVLDIAGIDPDLGFKRPEDVNEALDAQTLEFLRLLNKYVPRFKGKQVNPLRNNLVPLLAQASQGPLITLADDELDRFMRMFDESNRKVAVEYFGGALEGSDNPLFRRRSDKRERVQGAVLTPERAVELCAWLWQEKQSQVARLSGDGGKRKGQGGKMGGKKGGQKGGKGLKQKKQGDGMKRKKKDATGPRRRSVDEAEET
jgi:hypothetical protein